MSISLNLYATPKVYPSCSNTVLPSGLFYMSDGSLITEQPITMFIIIEVDYFIAFWTWHHDTDLETFYREKWHW